MFGSASLLRERREILRNCHLRKSNDSHCRPICEMNSEEHQQQRAPPLASSPNTLPETPCHLQHSLMLDWSHFQFRDFHPSIAVNSSCCQPTNLYASVYYSNYLHLNARESNKNPDIHGETKYCLNNKLYHTIIQELPTEVSRYQWNKTGIAPRWYIFPFELFSAMLNALGWAGCS